MTNLPSQPVYNFGLSKTSTNEQIKAYFERVLQLYQSNEKFPINLDDVWMLVYSAKNKAVRALKQNFIENEDYIPLTQNGQRSEKGQFAGGGTTYHLSVSCMEYLIAKKVRTVFNVYREVFKKVATGEVQVVAPKTPTEMLLMYAQQMVENERKVKMLESKQENLDKRLANVEARTTTTLPYTTIVGYANRFGIRMPREKACVLGRTATGICKQYGFEMGQVQDPRFGWVKTYPDGVLQETFEKFYPTTDFSNGYV